MADEQEPDNIIVLLRSIRVQAHEAEVNAYYKGNPEATKKINALVKERLLEMLEPTFIGDDLIEDLEVE